MITLGKTQPEKLRNVLTSEKEYNHDTIHHSKMHQSTNQKKTQSVKPKSIK